MSTGAIKRREEVVRLLRAGAPGIIEQPERSCRGEVVSRMLIEQGDGSRHAASGHARQWRRGMFASAAIAVVAGAVCIMVSSLSKDGAKTDIAQGDDANHGVQSPIMLTGARTPRVPAPMDVARAMADIFPAAAVEASIIRGLDEPLVFADAMRTRASGLSSSLPRTDGAEPVRSGELDWMRGLSASSAVEPAMQLTDSLMREAELLREESRRISRTMFAPIPRSFGG
jgi:hypothetical protein